MNKEPMSDDEGNIRELTLEEILSLRPPADVLPPELLEILPKHRPGERGKGQKEAKEAVTLRLDPEILRHFRADGPGWQSRINQALKNAIKA